MKQRIIKPESELEFLNSTFIFKKEDLIYQVIFYEVLYYENKKYLHRLCYTILCNGKIIKTGYFPNRIPATEFEARNLITNL